MKKSIFVFLLLTLCQALAVMADDAAAVEKSFRTAVVFYEKGDFEAARAELESIRGKGLSSGELFYNLGNVYFKKRDLGRAILNYERAKRYTPRDSDLLSNMRLARSLMKQKDPNPDTGLAVRMLERGADYLTLKELIAIESALYFMIAILIILAMFRRKIRAALVALAAGLLVIFSAEIVPLTHKIADLKGGAVSVVSITDARFEPRETTLPHFPLYEGMKVRILKSWGSWLKVIRPDGKIGWVKNDAVELIGVTRGDVYHGCISMPIKEL